MGIPAFFRGRHHSIQQRLMRIIVFVSATTLLLATAMMTYSQVKQTRQGMVDELSSLTAVIANNTKAAIAFNDRIDAEEVLSELKINPLVDAVNIYDLKGNVFAKYSRDDNINVQFIYPSKVEHEFRNKHLYVHHLIKDETGKLGEVFLQANLDKLNQQFLVTLKVVVLIFIFGVIISYILSMTLQKHISQPILNLAQTTRQIRQSKNYDERIEPSDITEIDQVRTEFNDLLEQVKLSEQGLKHLASHDPLTRLPNRAHFTDMLVNALMRGLRKSCQHAVLFIDLDRFKTINDSLGHSAGDMLLEKFSLKLLSTIRGDDSIARLGGDEFTILLQEVPDSRLVIEIANRIIDILKTPFQIAGHDVVVSPSIGIVMYPEHGATPEELMKNADTAMYAAKAEGGNKYVFFNNDMNIAANERLTIESDMRKGIKDDEFYLLYQPQVSVNEQKITGFEALCRWNKKGKTLVNPADFIPIAEETGLITDVGAIVLQQSFSQIKRWTDSGLFSGRVAVNISPKQFQQSDHTLFNTISELIGKYNLSPEYIELEITEAALMDQSGQMIRTMKRFKDLGFEFAIDDFGTGYSSLTYLSKFPIDTLKIDMSFISGMEFSASKQSIVKTIIDLAANLGHRVVAEGVETRAQFDILSKMGCDTVQGYLFSRPLLPEDAELFMRKINSDNIFPLFKNSN